MAVVDAFCKFTVVDISQYGSSSDGGVWRYSNIGAKLDNDILVLPGYSTIPTTTFHVPDVFIGDEGYQLRPNFMSPYPGNGLRFMQRIFNYQLSRARSVSNYANLK